MKITNTVIAPQYLYKLSIQVRANLDWLATDADDIATQSHSSFACSRGKIRLVENSLLNKISLLSRVDLGSCIMQSNMSYCILVSSSYGPFLSIDPYLLFFFHSDNKRSISFDSFQQLSDKLVKRRECYANAVAKTLLRNPKRNLL
jgi:hypothetical protein